MNKSMVAQPWATYRVRRIYSGRGRPSAVEKLATFASEADATVGLPALRGTVAALRPAKVATAGEATTASPAKGKRTAQIPALVGRPGGATLAQGTEASGNATASAGSGRTQACAAPRPKQTSGFRGCVVSTGTDATDIVVR